MKELSLNEVIVAVFLSGVVVLFTRVLPYAAFSRVKRPAFIGFIEKYFPPMIIAILLFYCFKDISFTAVSPGVPYIASCIFCALIHWKAGSFMASICLSTALYMVLIRLI